MRTLASLLDSQENLDNLTRAEDEGVMTMNHIFEVFHHLLVMEALAVLRRESRVRIPFHSPSRMNLKKAFCRIIAQSGEREGPSNCSSCPPYLVLEKGLCIECFAWQFYDNRRKSCRSCHPSCRTCSGPGPVSCKSCALPLRFDRIDNQCLPCCTPGMNPPDCCPCDQETGECLNYSSGGKRRTAAGADSGEAGAMVGEQDSPSLRVEPFATVTALAICGCATVVVLFGLIFTILQVHSNCNSCWKQGYEKLPTRSRKEMTEKISLAEDEETLSDQDDDEEQLFTKT